VGEAVSGRLPALTAASPSSPDSAQSSQGARLPRLILGNDWLDTVQALIKLAHLIVVDCHGLNPGLRKELVAIEQCGKCDNTVILLHRDRSELDQTEGFARAMADIAGGTLAASPAREWMTTEHPLLAPFEKVGYIEDLEGTDIADSALFGDLLSSRHFIRSAIRLAQKGVELAGSGSPPEAADYLQVAIVMAQGIPGWEERSTTWFNLGVIAHAIDRHEEAIAAFRQAHAAAIATKNLTDQGRSLSMLGEESMRARRFTDAVASLIASLAPLDAVQETAYLTRSLRLLAEACRVAGEPERAAAAHAELQRLEQHGQWSQDSAGRQFKTLFLNLAARDVRSRAGLDATPPPGP
jgi:tetratricopeptide (TPR) repeat protein